jgi:hypothetical protein
MDPAPAVAAEHYMPEQMGMLEVNTPKIPFRNG